MGIVISMAAITPKKLKIDAYRLELLNALRKEGTQHRRILKRTVTTWKTKPKFESLIGLDKKTATVLTGPSGNKEAAQRWGWINNGTPPRIIRARRAPYLRFSWPNTAKTRVGKFTSGRGSKGRNWARKRSVRHPGIKKRGWTELLTKKRRGPYILRMKRAMADAAKKTFK
jgi:hypothetical protein